MVQCLGNHASTAGSTSPTPGWETKDPACCIVQSKHLKNEKLILKNGLTVYCQ